MNFKKTLILLALLVYPIYVAAQTTMTIFIDQANTSIMSKDGKTLRIGSIGDEGVAFKGPLDIGSDDILLDISTKVAAGSTNADATALTTPYTYVTASNDAKGVKLYAASTGAVRFVQNTVADKVLKIYPPALDGINGGTVTTAAASCTAGSLCICVKVKALTWYCSL